MYEMFQQSMQVSKFFGMTITNNAAFCQSSYEVHLTQNAVGTAFVKFFTTAPAMLGWYADKRWHTASYNSAKRRILCKSHLDGPCPKDYLYWPMRGICYKHNTASTAGTGRRQRTLACRKEDTLRALLIK
eukprot:gene25786-1735_t